MRDGPRANACGAHGILSAAHLDALAELLTGNTRVLRAVLADGPDLRCVLEEHSGPHMDLVHDSGAGRALWAQWAEPHAEWLETVLVLPDCPAATRRGPGCWSYLSHPGAHTWELTPPWATWLRPAPRQG